VLSETLKALESPARLESDFVRGTAPTQAYSEFLTNREQGDWAESTFIKNFNATGKEFWAVKYGRSENFVAGESGFEAFYESYQDELGTLGKRPDILIFDREEFHARYGDRIDISTIPLAQTSEFVSAAKLAIEVRSSAFLLGKYEAFSADVRARNSEIVQACLETLSDDFPEELALNKEWEIYVESAQQAGVENLAPPPRVITKKSTKRLAEAGALTRKFKEAYKGLKKRDFLSVTPKAEDLSAVYRWLKNHNVPHYYCQMFFDRAILISFERILQLLSDPTREEIDFFVETDEKNQGKTTFKINVKLGKEVMKDIQLPKHRSSMKELPKGRLLFYVCFDPSVGTVDPREIMNA